MNTPTLKTERLILRRFTEKDMEALFLILKDGLSYITATHDRNNPRSGRVMQKVGMTYCYSYEEQWKPKDFPVIFRMYQLNFDSHDDFVYKKYWNMHSNHFIENF